MNPSVSRTPLRLPLPKRGAPCWLRLGTVFDGHEVLTDAHLVYDAKRILHVGGSAPTGRSPTSTFRITPRCPD